MLKCVTPFAGVWIEMSIKTQRLPINPGSLPSRECGLKFNYESANCTNIRVTPFAGVWIEIRNPHP